MAAPLMSQLFPNCGSPGGLTTPRPLHLLSEATLMMRMMMTNNSVEPSPGVYDGVRSLCSPLKRNLPQTEI